MKKMVWFILAVVLFSGLSLQAAMKVSQDQFITGETDFWGPLQIRGTTVTATAAELNALDASVTTAATAGNTGLSLTVGTLTARADAVVQLTTTNRTVTSADYGKIIIINTNAAVTLTLPANGATAGSWVEVVVHGSATDACAPTIAAATADTLVGPNDVDLDSVTWGTGHRIGAQAKFWSDGTLWHVRNLGGTTMTYTD